jgi:amino acid adenylation domain-containing protein
LPGISEAKRRLLEMRLRGEVQQQPAASKSITPLPSDAVRQLSFAQERLWFLNQLTPGSAVFNVPLAVRLSGPIEPQTLERSVNEIVRRHEALRTTFANVDGRALPVSSPELSVKLQLVDLTSLPGESREAKAHSLLSATAAAPFDLAVGPLIRTTLVKLDEEQHVFLVVMHHIVSDGWSLVLFFQELSTLYVAFTRGEESPLRDLAVQYADYAAWQREWLQGKTLQTQINYWKNKLGGEVPALELPTDRPRPAVQTFNGARRWLTLPEPLTDAVLALSQREGATLFMTMLAAFKVLLYRYTGQEDVIVGSPIANRPQSETESLIGFFLNNLALRSDLSGNPSFRETLARVRTTALEAYANQDVPFEKLIDALKPTRDLSRTPIFQVYFNLFNFGAEIKLPGSDETVSFVEAWAQSDEDLSKFDLTLYAGLQDRELKLAFVYKTDLFDAATIELMLAHFTALLEAVVAEPDETIANFSLSTGPQVQPKSIRPTNSFIEFRKQEIEQSITDRFASQVEKYAERVAIKTRNHEWTYEQLNTTVNRVAQQIVGTAGALARNGSPNSTPVCEERIALLFEHDAPMIAGMLGALRAGKTYVPLDPHHPAERLAQIIEHCQATAILTNNKNLALARDLTERVWSAVAERSSNNALDEISPPESKAPSLRSATPLQNRLLNIVNIDHLTRDSQVELPTVDPSQLAYILYTSGSTGQPKGVMQNHRNVLHYIRVYTNNLHLNAADRLTLFSSYCFDASVMDIYGALLNGATLFPIDLKEDGLAGLPEQLIADEITVYHSTPTVYRHFVNELGGATRKFNFTKLRVAVLGGEKVTRADVESYQRHFASDCLFVNGLGPTEATVTLQNFIDKQTKITGESVPIGFPVENTDVLLLNKSGKPAEVCGEIAIKSEHVALGYWKNPEATARAFSTNGDGPHVRTYRTGDMGRRLPDGSIRFEGRKDFQIKIRGFRVELGEIEAVLGSHAQVRECAVVALENNGGDTKLIAYVVPTATVPSLRTELRDFLKQKLPEYMVPGAFIVIDSLPLTASGKLNRRALPAPESLECDTVDTRKVDPRTPLQALLVAIWSGLLGVTTIGIDDNFFELGGHSMLAVLLFAQIEKRLGKRLPLATLFQAPTVAQLAAVIQKDWTSEWSSLVAINPVERAQDISKPPFFCVHALGGNVLEYYDLAKHLGADQPFYGLQSVGLDGSGAPHTRVEDMAAHYIKEMRELQPEGPYFIGGRSLGGMVAFEMAQQLKAQGQTIGLLALLDTYPSGYAKLFRNEGTLRAALARAWKRTKAHLANLQTLSVNDGLSYLFKKARFAPRKLKSQVWRRLYNAYEKLDQSFEILGRPLPRAFRDVKEFNSLAVRDYTPKVYDGKVTLFWASADLRTSIDLVEGWRALAGGGMEVHEIPGSHLDIIKEPHVGELATKLSSCLDRAQST